MLLFPSLFDCQICENYGPNLDTCPEGTVLGLLVDTNSCLHLYVNGMDQGVAAQDIPSPCYPFIDLYGQCEQVCTMNTHTHTRAHELTKIQDVMLKNGVPSSQVTIVTKDVPAVGGESGEGRCQGDMEKADMVDGKNATAFLFRRLIDSFGICPCCFDGVAVCSRPRNQRERVLDAPSRGQPQQDVRVPGTVLALQGPADVTR